MRNFKTGFLIATLALTGLVGCDDDENGGNNPDAAVSTDTMVGLITRLLVLAAQ